MLTDRYDLPLSTTSPAARDAYVQGCEARLTMYPGAIEAFDRAIAADPAFAVAHAAKAHALLERGDAAASREAIAAANAVTAGLSARETSHIAFFALLIAGNTQAALAALPAHLDAWPHDTMVLGTTAFTNGLIGKAPVAPARNACCWPCWTASLFITATTGGSPPITAWRCPRTASTTPPARRSTARWRRTQPTHGRRTPTPICPMKRGRPMRPAPF